MAQLGSTQVYGDLKVDGEIKNKATTSTEGVVQLNDAVNSTSTTQGATANAVKKVNDTLATHSSNTTSHITSSERSSWNAKASTAVASTSANGLMSKEDKTKLNGIATGANNYVHPNDAGTRHVSDAEKNTWNAKASTAVVTTSANGLMSKEDKTKLNGIATGANNYTHPSTHPASVITQDATHRFVTDTEKSTWNGKANSNHTHLVLNPQYTGNGGLQNPSYFGLGLRLQMMNGLPNSNGSYHDCLVMHSYISDVPICNMLAFSKNGDGRIEYYSQNATGTTWTHKGRIYHTGSKPTKADVGLSNVNNWGATTAVNSTSTTTYATASAVKQAYDLASSKASTAVVSTTTNGLMSKEDKVKLNGIATGANNYSHPSSHPASMITGLIGKKGTGDHSEIFNYSSNKSTGYCSHAEGMSTQAGGHSAHAEGYGCVASGDGTHAEGANTEAKANYSHAEGRNSITTGLMAHAEGGWTTAAGQNSHSEGYETTAGGFASHAEGDNTTAETFAIHVQGRFNKVNSGNATAHSATHNAYVIGNGTSASAKSNAFRVTFNGKTYGLSAFNSTGADYAEYFEWLDGNPDNEDRVGRFVALDGNKIKIANSENDYIVGIISGNQSIIGNACEDSWNDMYIRDEFDRLQYEDVEVEREEEVFNEETNEYETKTVKVTETHIKLNPNYNPSVEYIPRSERKEWGVVGMLGQIKVRDDGTCKVNGFCKPSIDGIATHTDDKSGYRVMERINDNLIRVIMK